MTRPLILVILDGWGYRTESTYNAIAHAETPTTDMLMATYPWTTLQAAGVAVGTLPGYIGNSQIGHMTLGSGTIIEQPLTAISYAIQSEMIDSWQWLASELRSIRESGGNLHIMGLLSDGGVHSHEQHMYALIRYAAACGISTPILHPFLDGRDTPPRSAASYLTRLEQAAARYGNGYIATLMGRYYAMDRDENWERTLAAYHTLTHASSHTQEHVVAPRFSSWHTTLDYYYRYDMTDEFIPPTRFTQTGCIADNDGVICINFRADRMRQLAALLTQRTDIPQFSEAPQIGKSTQPRQYTYAPVKLTSMVTGSAYHPDFPPQTLYTQPRPKHTLCDVYACAEKRIYRIAETQKYAHVTYFFNGGDERTYQQETRTLIPSKKVATFAEAPAMSAHEITEAVTTSLAEDPHDLYVINYANPDMVAHTGNFAATKSAVTHTDAQLRTLYEAARAHDADMCITADHGNAEEMQYPDGTPRTSHTHNPVPCIWVTDTDIDVSDMYGLADVAPAILTLAGLNVPDQMRYSYGIAPDQSNTDKQ